MGTITPRKNKDGSTSYKAQVRVRKGKKVVFQETQTFERRQAAAAWAKKLETDLNGPGGLAAATAEDPLLSFVIDKYLEDNERDVDRTKRGTLLKIKDLPLGAKRCSAIESADIVSFAKSLNIKPQTRSQYVTHLATVMMVARPAWGYPINFTAMLDARMVMKRMGIIGKSNRRDRRPTMDQINTIMGHFWKIRERTPESCAMPAMIAFTVFAIRRAGEICRITWDDLDEDACRVMVRDLKHPHEKKGNDQWCDLTPEAMRIVKAQPKIPGEQRIFPFVTNTVSSSFSNGMRVLGIEDFHLNDLRHEGASRLSEMGWTIQRVAAVTGHRSWTTLKRYTHVRQVGDKFAGWKWLDTIAPQATPAS